MMVLYHHKQLHAPNSSWYLLSASKPEAKYKRLSHKAAFLSSTYYKKYLNSSCVCLISFTKPEFNNLKWLKVLTVTSRADII
jgi:hypothetical protein